MLVFPVVKVTLGGEVIFVLRNDITYHGADMTMQPRFDILKSYDVDLAAPFTAAKPGADCAKPFAAATMVPGKEIHLTRPKARLRIISNYVEAFVGWAQSAPKVIILQP